MNRQTVPSDFEREITSRLIDNDESALELVIRSIVPKTMAYLKRKFGTLCMSEDYEDAMSIALYRLWSNRAHVDTRKGSVAGWFYVIAKNALIEVVRRRERQRKPSEANQQCDAPIT